MHDEEKFSEKNITAGDPAHSSFPITSVLSLLRLALAEGNAKDRDDLIYLEPLPLFDKNGNAL